MCKILYDRLSNKSKEFSDTMSTPLSKIIRKFKASRPEDPEIYSLDLCDISTPEALPDSSIFKHIKDMDYNDVSKKHRSPPKLPTSEKFYRNGILENVFFKEELSLESPDQGNLQKTLNTARLNLFPQKICSYNWLLAFCTCFHYASTLCKFGIGKNSSEKNSINVLNLGNGCGDFIAGIYYYFKQSNISKVNNLTAYDLNWYGVDVKNNDTSSGFKRLSKYHNNIEDNIIHGFVDDNMLDYKNVQYVKTLLENKFDATHIIFNNIKPDKNSGKILLSIALLSEHLYKDGIMITKILHPGHWDKSFEAYLTILALTFHNTKLLKFPVCKNNKSYFRYYLIGFDVKKLLYKNKARRKLINMLRTDEIEVPQLIDSLYNENELIVWRTKLADAKHQFLNDDNPTAELHCIIDKLKDVL